MAAATDPTSLRPIICGTDFSDNAAHAVTAACAIATRLGAPLVLVHSLDELGEIPSPYRPEMCAPAHERLRRTADELRQAGVEVEEKLLDGVPNDGIGAYAENRHARLIVLAASGTGALGRWVLGSVAERVAESASVPTLVVRNATPFEQWARNDRPLKILAGIDFSPPSDAALRTLAELREAAPCEIELAFVDRPRDERAELAVFDALRLTEETPEARSAHAHDLQAKATRLLGVPDVKVHVVPGSARIDAHLVELATVSRADVIALGVHQYHGLARVWHRSISRRVLHDVRHNVLCVPAKATAKPAHETPEIRRVLVATDFSEAGNRTVAFASSLAPAGGALCALYVAGPAEDVGALREQLRTLLPPDDGRISIDIRIDVHPKPAEAICDAANRFDAHVVCVGSHGHSALRQAIIGSVTQSVIAQSTRPVLVVPRVVL